MDQAQTLRKLMKQRGNDEAISSGPPIQVVTVASGKGGVGKSSLSANLAALLARSGLRVLLVDGDFGLANLDILLGVQGGATLEQVLSGEATLQDAILGIEPGFWLLPASSGLMASRKGPEPERQRLVSVLERIPWDMDVILVDAGAGIQDNVLSLHGPTQHSLVVLTPEPTSLADAYGLIKVLRRQGRIHRASVIVNQVTDGREAQAVFQRLKDVASKFIDVELDYLGHCPRDEKFTQAVMNRKILIDWFPDAPAVSCLELLAKRLRSAQLGLGGEPRLARVPAVRFRDEPVLSAPRKTTMFWRTLLGEVKV